MSKQEELAARGQFFEDYRVARERLVSMRVSLDRQVTLLRGAASHIHGTLNPPRLIHDSATPDPPEWEAIYPIEKTCGLLGDYSAELKRVNKMEEELRLLGLPVGIA